MGGGCQSRQTIIGNGPGKDTNLILGRVLGATGNADLNTNYILDGYDGGDLNLDGKTVFAGPDNDVNLLLGNVLLHPDNALYAANYIINGGLK
ncbi:MAG: hypothetical protein R3E89_04950 [Thiolinea sp.]